MLEVVQQRFAEQDKATAALARKVDTIMEKLDQLTRSVEMNQI